MNSRSAAALALLLVCLLLAPTVLLAAPEKRVALVIGNGAYATAPLVNPVNDAADMAALLEELGFEVVLERDVGMRAMEQAVGAFMRRLRGSEVGLFYFAGHGLQLDGLNYLVPVDADINSESDTRYRTLPADWVLGKMEDAGNPVNIVVLDACRSNPFTRGFRSPYRGLAQMRSPKGSIITYATAPGEVAADGEGRNGLFTKHMMRHMKTRGIKVEELFKRVREDVWDESGHKQLPWTSSSIIGDFSFAVGVATIQTGAAAPGLGPQTMPMRFWLQNSSGWSAKRRSSKPSRQSWRPKSSVSRQSSD